MNTFLAILALAVLTPAAFGQMVWKKAKPKASPEARWFHAMAYDSARQRMVMFGGDRTRQYWPRRPALTGTWEYDGSTWVRRKLVTDPSPRMSHTMAYDSSRRVVVMFGGAGGNISSSRLLNETWEYDGKNWRLRKPKVSPPTLTGHAMVYDSARRVMVVVGGVKKSNPLTMNDEVWEWNGVNWRRRFVANPPPLRSAHQMVYDAARGVVVLTGGVSVSRGIGTQHSTQDPWEWDGSKVGFVLHTYNAPGPYPSWSRMVYDRARQRSVWIGVRYIGGNPTHVSETWEWDGKTWRQRAGKIDPFRAWHAVAYDSKRERIVLFSGVYAAEYDDTWEYYATHRSSAVATGAGCAGTAGTPKLSANGPPIMGNRSFGIRLDSARPNSPAFVGLALKPANVPIGGCTLFLDASAPILIAGRSNANGVLDLRMPIPFTSALSGFRVETQGFVHDPKGTFFGQLAFTPALRLVIGD